MMAGGGCWRQQNFHCWKQIGAGMGTALPRAGEINALTSNEFCFRKRSGLSLVE